MALAEEVWSISSTGALRQGEILSHVQQTYLDPATLRSPDSLNIDVRTHAWVVVLTQDCDTDWDYRARQDLDGIEGHNKEVPNVLLCEALTQDELRARPQIKSDIWRRIRDNQDERFHALPEIPARLDREGEGVPDLILDFKRCFTIPTPEMYARLQLRGDDGIRRRAWLKPPYREQVADRAFAFHARVAVPD